MNKLNIPQSATGSEVVKTLEPLMDEDGNKIFVVKPRFRITKKIKK